MTEPNDASPNSAPIATYRERIHGLVDRRFNLYTDRIVVQGSQSFGAQRFETPIRLTELQPDYARVWVRSRYHGLSLVAVALLIPLVLLQVFAQLPLKVWVMFLAIEASVITLFVLSMKRIEYLQFRNKSGLVVLDIGKHGPETDKYYSFVDRLVSEIRKDNTESK